MPNSNQKNLIARPPVVVIMGHIDHGKSTLLDYIRKTKIVEGEAGGITQHVGAYQAECLSGGAKHLITFLDTPGHEAFCNIRERGAQAADIAILVVSGEDGVKPQTVEAYKNIVAEKIPYIVAITKIDKPNANVEKVKQSLGENEIYVEGWGGDIPCISISALTGAGIDDLLDMIILVSELANLKYDPTTSASGVVVESSLDAQKGISATILLKDGKLESGSFVSAGEAYVPVRFIEDYKGSKINEATASLPIRIMGWSQIPECGAKFITVNSKKEAEKIVEEAEAKRKVEEHRLGEEAKKAAKIATTTTPSVAGAIKSASDLKESANLKDSGKVAEAPQVIALPIVIKADVIGSLQGIEHELVKIKHDKVKVTIVAKGIGPINESDVKMAQSDPSIIIIGFNVKPENKAKNIIERSAIPLNVKTFKIIYELSQFVNETLLSKVPKEYMEEVTGRAKILAVFSKEKDRQVVGGKCENGEIGSGNDVKISRRETEIGRGKIRELQSKKLKVSSVAEGFEFGMLLDAKVEVAVGDRIEAVRTVEKS
ncbi:MAG: translation initiation factor IF-2 [Candidatus Paceibacterota bacterium]